MESSLHRRLKELFGPDQGGRAEVRVGAYRVDAIDAEGRLVEIQAGPLGAIRAKLARLLDDHDCRVVKPIVVARRIVRRARADGPDLSARRSLSRGALLDVFDDLVGLARIFPHPRLTVEVLGVSIDEVRVPGRKGRGRGRRERVVDRRLVEVVSTATLRSADDLWGLLPAGLDGPSTSLDYARRLGRPVAFAQKLAYCLRHAGAVEERGFVRRRRLYERVVAFGEVEA